MGGTNALQLRPDLQQVDTAYQAERKQKAVAATPQETLVKSLGESQIGTLQTDLTKKVTGSSGYNLLPTPELEIIDAPTGRSTAFQAQSAQSVRQTMDDLALLPSKSIDSLSQLEKRLGTGDLAISSNPVQPVQAPNYEADLSELNRMGQEAVAKIEKMYNDAAPTVTTKKQLRALDGHAIDTLYPIVEVCEGRIRSYLAQIDERNDKVKFLEDFKQHLRSAGEPVDWENNPEKRLLVEKAKAHGVMFPEGPLQWSKEMKTDLLRNVDGTIDPLLSGNDKDRVMLGWFQNKASEWLALITNLIKKHHEAIEYNLRNW